MKIFKFAASIVTASILVACGGGGGSSTDTSSIAPVTPPVVAKKTPLPVLATSYENKIVAGKIFGSQKLPDGVASGMKSNYEHVLAGVAYGDFFQDGSYSMVVQSSDYTPIDPLKVPGGGSQYAPLVPGGIYFYKKDSAGNWINNTSALLKDQTGCIQVRKMLVADFNKDGKPDVFLSCTGPDQGPGVGEYSRVLLSQPDGTYTNTEVKETCYCHSATAVDINNDGYPDVVAWNNSATVGRVGPFVLVNNKNGTFTKTYDLLPHVADQRPNASAMVADYWTMEAIDVNADGKVDLIFAGKYHNYVSPTQADDRAALYLNDGTGTFVNTNRVSLPAAPNGFNLVVDILFENGYLYFYNMLDAGSGENIADIATGYVEQGIQKINMTTFESIALFETHDGSNRIHALSSWIVFFGGNIVDMDAAFSKTKIPM